MVTLFTALRGLLRAISKVGAQGATRWRSACVAALAALLGASTPALASPASAKPHATSVLADSVPAIRGVTVGPIESSQQAGRGYGTPYSAELLDALVDLGANAISITPFGRIWSLHSTSIVMDFEAPYAANR